MPGMTTAEHQRALRETKARRNSGQRYGRALHTNLSRARQWVAAMDARVETMVTPTGPLFTVHVAGFHSQTAWRLADAVDVLDAHIADWCDSPATHGPTGARLAPLCEKRRLLLAGRTGAERGG